jgi:hypothetical protein
MISHNKWTFVFVFLLLGLLVFQSGCSPPDKTARPKDNPDPAAKPASIEPTSSPQPTPSPSPTIEYQDGKANIDITRTLATTSSNFGVISHSVTGTVPVTIKFNQEKQVWEVKGSNLGAGETQFTNPECNCQATWGVEFTVSGVLVPMGGLISEPDEGCYVQIYINEDWEQYDAACNCTIGQSVVETQPEQMQFGPLKLGLEENFSTAENETIGDTAWEYRWMIKDLDVPLATGCVAGEGI